MESPQPLTLVPAASRRRRHEDGESRRRRRSRSRDRERRRGASPPADWRGPADNWRPPPAEWAGYAPPNHMPWPPPQRPMYRPPGPSYGPWGVPPPREPMDWRPGGAGAPGTWTAPSAPPNHWGGGPPAHWGGPPSTPFAKGPFEQSPAPAAENGHSVGPVPPAEPAVEEPLPPVPTASERLRSVRLVSSALSEQVLEKLHSLGVMPKKGKEVLEKAVGHGPGPTDASAQCELLGLGFGHGQATATGRLPAPTGKRRVPATPVCTLSLAPGGLWERFRQRCGTPWPQEPPVFNPQLRGSKVVLAVKGDR